MAQKKTSQLRRRLTKQLQQAVRPYALAVGELVWASNHCLNVWSMFYRELFDGDHINIAVRTWHSARSDKAQLDFVGAAIMGKRSVPDTLREEVMWALGRSEKLAEKRNDAVHSGTRFIILPRQRIRIGTSSISTHPSRAAKLSLEPSLIRAFGASRDDFVQLAGYAFHLWEAVKALPGTYPLPKRPQLRSLPLDTPRKKQNASPSRRAPLLRP